MKFIILLAVVLVAVAVAAPPEPVKIIHSAFEQKPEGSYQFGFETEDGIVRDETGELKETLDDEKKPHTVVIVRGSYSYTDKDGKRETVNYFADENGYHAEGDSIPKPVSRR